MKDVLKTLNINHKLGIFFVLLLCKWNSKEENILKIYQRVIKENLSKSWSISSEYLHKNSVRDNKY